MQEKIKISKKIIRKAMRFTIKPLVVNFSGGKDSLVLLHLVRKVTDDFICFYCDTSLEFDGLRSSVIESVKASEVELVISHPNDYKGDFFKRISDFKRFPTIKRCWCKRDLKWRPQSKVLIREFGRGVFFKLGGVRRSESKRRMGIFSKYNNPYFLRVYDVVKDVIVNPILDWSDEERDRYLFKNRIEVFSKNLYKRFGVSSCRWCPFYQKEIFERVLYYNINMYNDIIYWEKRLNKPSSMGYLWLGKIKEELKKQSKITEYFN